MIREIIWKQAGNSPKKNNKKAGGGEFPALKVLVLFVLISERGRG